MEFRRYTFNVLNQLSKDMPFRPHPVRIIVSLLPVITGRVAVLPISVSVVHTGLDTPIRTGKV